MNYTKTELHALRRIWEPIEQDNTFGSFDDFIRWAWGRYKAGFAIYKLREYNPHGPDNSYWYHRTKELPVTESPFCAGCDKPMVVCNINGCFKYRQDFVKNWNENICRKPKEVPYEKPKHEVFRYEHPDLVREGIFFDGNNLK